MPVLEKHNHEIIKTERSHKPTFPETVFAVSIFLTSNLRTERYWMKFITLK